MGGGGSPCEHKETWSSQQDVINVTSSVGTRGSSTVHSDRSQEERGKNGFFFQNNCTRIMFLPHQVDLCLPSAHLACMYIRRVF